MRKIKLPEFDKATFKNQLDDIRKLAMHHPEDFAEQLKVMCQKVGVGLVYSLSFPGAPISGVVRWVGGNPLIQLTDRYKSNDQFWSAFFHEAGHIIIHGKKDVFIEDFEGVVIDEKKENEANNFSDEWLVPSKYLETVDGTITEKEIRALARQIGIHPGILVGRLQQLKIIDYNFANNLKLKVQLTDEIYSQAKG
jgi:HTH-type transcriptional regulator / antitoxin HigA